MATMILTNGSRIPYLPAEKIFTLKEMQEAVGGPIELIRSCVVFEGKIVDVWADEEGKLKYKSINNAATDLFMNDRPDFIVGTVLITERKETVAEVPRADQYAVYNNPSDFPGKYVVRGWYISSGGITANPEAHAVAGTLEEARASLPKGLTCLPRFVEDDPCIVEVWL